MSPPAVSIIIASKDRPDYLSECISSLRCQSISEWEAIVVDDGSKDRMGVEKVAKVDPRIHLLRLDVSQGPAHARNVGLEQACGEFVGILDDDDIAVPDRLAEQVRFLEENPETDMTFSAVQWFRGQREPLGRFPGVVLEGRWPETPREVFELLYLHSNKIPNTTVLFRRRILPFFRYPEWTRIGEDWFLFMQLAARGIRMAPVAKCLVWQRRDSAAKSLVQDRIEFEAAQVAVLARLEEWLHGAGMPCDAALRRRAWSNLHVRRATRISGWSGAAAILKALAYHPVNSTAWHCLSVLAGRGIGKARRAFSGDEVRGRC